MFGYMQSFWLIFRPHRICVALRWGLLLLTFPWSVGRSVCWSVWNETIRYPAKTAGPIEMPFGMWGGVGDSHHVLDGGADPPTVRGNFGTGKGPSHSKV